MKDDPFDTSARNATLAGRIAEMLENEYGYEISIGLRAMIENFVSTITSRNDTYGDNR